MTAPAFRIVSLQGLIDRLETVLGRDALLFVRFKRALRTQDEVRLTAAMETLRVYPPAQRQLVEDTIMAWLFGGASDTWR